VQLPYTAIRGRYLFVHAGARPYIRLEHQAKDDLIWILRPFLDSTYG
jgi:serine/threonine protein phosphatase 1